MQVKLLTQSDLLEHLNTLLNEFNIELHYEYAKENDDKSTIVAVKVLQNEEFVLDVDGNNSIEALMSLQFVLAESIFVLLTAFNAEQPMAHRNQMLGTAKVALQQYIEDRYTSALDNSAKHVEVIH